MVKDKTTKQITAHFPIAFVNRFKKFVDNKSKNGDGITRVTEKEIIYRALTEYMDNNK